jgi:pimeloyl-ACP methyl ester carboxylesterase
MASRVKMRDMIVVLPGITGSVLEKKGVGEFWAPLPIALLTYIKNLGESLDALRLENDDPEAPDAPDGVRATRVVPYTLIPGLHRFDGYTGLRKKLHANFDLTDGETHGSGPPANYFEFPYDWRRDNRASAQNLKRLIDRELPRWQERYPQAKVILLAHSMGGLVCRWYLEKLGGNERVKALVTFATPHRGSPSALDFIANGYRKLWLDFTAVLRSYDSVYQLLPIYEAVQSLDGAWRRPAEVDVRVRDPSKGRFDRAKAQAALQFHRAIEDANATHRLDEAGVAAVLPIQGWGQDTLQSCKITERGVDMSNDLPPVVDDVYSGGDGTVPRVSAIPLELDGMPTRLWPFNQRHSTIQDAPNLLDNLAQVLRYYQGEGKPPARAPGVTERGGAALDVDDVYLTDEPVTVSAAFPEGTDPGDVRAEIRARLPGEEEGPAAVPPVPLKPDADRWTGSAQPLPPGSYRVTLRVGKQIPGMDAPLVDIFEVA